MVWSTAPTGTISQIARGFVRALTNSASDAAPTASPSKLRHRLRGLSNTAH